MVQEIRSSFTCKAVKEGYAETGNVNGLAQKLGVSYVTALTLAHDCGVKLKRPGYTAPEIDITGKQCRHAREYLGFTRDQFCKRAGIGKTALRQFELGHSTVRKATLEKIMTLFEDFNIEFNDVAVFSDANK
ncbi:helix-turn-helix domain-containing protein [Halomonas casei]|uniref:helix-turn-helix domain-containing protein n=1 Tax=Halomonas casei TaxID=2742613 RepID=UPI003CEC6579